MIRTAGVLALIMTGALAQNRDPGDSVIRSSTRLVQVSVVVHGKNGSVEDLTKEDFVLTDRGKPQTIGLFTRESTKHLTPVSDPLPANTFSNRFDSREGAPTGVTIILLDGLNTPFEDQASAKRHLIQFLKSVNPKDRVAIYTLNKTLRVLCDFTDSPEQIERLLAKFRGSVETDFSVLNAEPSNTGNDDLDLFIDTSNRSFANGANLDRARLTLAAFVSIANHAAELPGRKNLIWLTGSLPFSLVGGVRALNSANIAVYPVDARGLIGMPRALTAAAASTNKPGRPAPMPSFRPVGLDTMQQLADETGGRAFYDVNDLSGAIRAAFKDSATTYWLGFYPEAGALDGKFHELKVKVQRPSVNVRYRKGYLARKDSAVPDDQTRDSLEIALNSPLESSSISLQAKIDHLDEPKPNSLKIAWSIDIHDLHLTQDASTWKGAVNVFFVQRDAAGNQIDTIEEAFDIRLTPETYQTYLSARMVFNKVIQVKAGISSLRVLVADRSTASVGSLIIPVSRIH